MQCPMCGSKRLSHTTGKRYVGVKHGSRVPYQAHLDTCHDCGEEGDFLCANEDLIEQALYQSEKVAVERLARMIREKHGTSESSLELALCLPQGTINYWCLEGPAEGAYMLLSFVYAFPALLEWADESRLVGDNDSGLVSE